MPVARELRGLYPGAWAFRRIRVGKGEPRAGLHRSNDPKTKQSVVFFLRLFVRVWLIMRIDCTGPVIAQTRRMLCEDVACKTQ
jgi:hypothetical protein